MTRRNLTVAQLAAEAGLEVDEVLIHLWDADFPGLSGPRDVIRKGDANRARRALGLATRRELESPDHWAERLGMSGATAVLGLLASLGVSQPLDGGRLRGKAIRRLRAEERTRGTAATSGVSPTPAPATEPEELVWASIGHVAEVVQLTYGQVEGIHNLLVADFAGTADPMEPAGVRSRQLLESALSRPATSMGGIRKYPTIEMSAAALLHSLVHDHPFHNGNKRTALVSMLVLLDENGLMLTCGEDELFRLVLQLAKHAVATGPRGELPDREVLAVAEWLKGRVRWIAKGERALSWRKVRQALGEHGVVCTPVAGNRINLTRKVTRLGGFFRSDRIETLHTQMAYAGEGTEVAKNTINTIRRELELDEAHGIDSAAFYDRESVSPSEFIHRYRKTLRRLAKL